MTEGRALTLGETALAHLIFADAIDYDAVRIVNRRWFPFQPRDTVMAPCGHLHIHPGGDLWPDDYATAEWSLRGLFVHELCHVWQAQRRGRFYLPLMRHPFCRYGYRLEPGRPRDRYGLEQQAEIVRHAWLLRVGRPAPGRTDRAAYERLLVDAFAG